MNRLLLGISFFIGFNALADDPAYFTNEIKGVAYVDAFTRASFVFTPGKLEECKPAFSGFVCNVKDGGLKFEKETTHSEFVFTTVNIYLSKDKKSPQSPDTGYSFRGTYSDNLPATDQKIKTSVSMSAKGDNLTGLLTMFEDMFGSPIAKVDFFGKIK